LVFLKDATIFVQNAVAAASSMVLVVGPAPAFGSGALMFLLI
jgi:hypothetical protein